MNNLEYLEKVKDTNVTHRVVEKVGEHEIEHRKMKALEIIAEELCKITRRNARIDEEMENEE